MQHFVLLYTCGHVMKYPIAIHMYRGAMGTLTLKFTALCLIKMSSLIFHLQGGYVILLKQF